MKVGDLVIWVYDKHNPLENVKQDVGLIIDIEEWKYDDPSRKIIKVLFAHAGLQWCNEKALEIISSATTH